MDRGQGEPLFLLQHRPVPCSVELLVVVGLSWWITRKDSGSHGRHAVLSVQCPKKVMVALQQDRIDNNDHSFVVVGIKTSMEGCPIK